MRPFSRYRLVSYQIEEFQALNTDGISYRLVVEHESFWGLFKWKNTVTKIVGYHTDANSFFKYKLNVWLTK